MTAIRDDLHKKDPLSKDFRKFYEESQKIPVIKPIIKTFTDTIKDKLNKHQLKKNT